MGDSGNTHCTLIFGILLDALDASVGRPSREAESDRPHSAAASIMRDSCDGQ